MLGCKLTGLGVRFLYDFDLHARFFKSVTEAWVNYATAGMAALGMWHSQFANATAERLEPAKPSPEPAASNPFAWWLNAFTPNTPSARASAPATTPSYADPFSWWLNAFTPATLSARASVPAVDQPYADPFSWWLNVWAPAPALAPEKNADFGAPFFQFAPSMAAWTSPSALIGGSGAGQNPWTQIQNFWTQNPWTQNPWFTNNPWFSAATNQNTAAWTSGWQDAMNACCWMWPNASFNAFQMPMTAWLMAAGLPYSVAAPTARANAASMDAAQAAREGFEKLMTTFRNDSGHALAPMFSALPKMATLLVPFWLLPRGLPGLG